MEPRLQPSNLPRVARLALQCLRVLADLGDHLQLALQLRLLLQQPLLARHPSLQLDGGGLHSGLPQGLGGRDRGLRMARCLFGAHACRSLYAQRALHQIQL